MIVRGRDEADLETVLQVPVAEPLEGPVLRHDLHQRLEIRGTLVPVASLVGMRNDQHLGRLVLGPQTFVHLGQGRRLLIRHPRTVARAEEDVVVPSEIPGGAPLVAENGEELSFPVAVPAELLEVPPLEVVHRRVVIGEGNEVEPRVVAGVAIELLAAALTFREAGVAVELAPIDSLFGGALDPDRIAPGFEPAVRRTDDEAGDPRAAHGQAFDAGRRLRTRGYRGDGLTV